MTHFIESENLGDSLESEVYDADNKGVEAIFQIGSPVESLQKMAVEVYLAANRFNITLFFQWRPRSDPLMILVDKGSRGPWLDFDDFSLDSETIREVKSRGVNLDAFASFHNKVVDRYFSLGFQVKNSGTNFFAQKLALQLFVVLGGSNYV